MAKSKRLQSKKTNSKQSSATSSSRTRGKKRISGPSSSVNLSEIQELIHLMNAQNIAELSFEGDGKKLSIKSNAAFPAPLAGALASSLGNLSMEPSESQSRTSGTKVPVAEAADGGSPLNQDTHKKILSPFVGTFYRAPSPESPPYVKEGTEIAPGDTLCIVEAMKLMNEIQSDYSGKITSVLVENGQPVEFGEPLFIVEV